jgi:endonuclease/exonuclease/phosphatase family metal-dependent hydrolase
MSDHRFEQRGLLHVRSDKPWGGTVHVVVVHLGLIKASRDSAVGAAVCVILRVKFRPVRRVVVAG